MPIRSIVAGTVLCFAAAACGGKATPAPAAPATAEPAPAEPPPAAEPPPSTPPPVATAAAPSRATPPQAWQQIGHRADGDVVMGALVWTGGDAFQVELMGSMKYMLQDEVTQAIKAQPDDPAAAIQGVLDRFNEMSKPMIEWVPAKVQ